MVKVKINLWIEEDLRKEVQLTQAQAGIFRGGLTTAIEEALQDWLIKHKKEKLLNDSADIRAQLDACSLAELRSLIINMRKSWEQLDPANRAHAAADIARIEVRLAARIEEGEKDV